MKSDFTRAVGSTQDREMEIQKRKLRENCREFETVMVNYLMKSMRDTISQAEEPEHGRAAFEDMLAGQLSKEIGKTGSLGIGDILYQKLEPQLKAQSAAHKSARTAKADALPSPPIDIKTIDPGPAEDSVSWINEEVLKK
ncbi:MAG: rod-binding protein [Syntrophobacter sp.]